MNDDTGLSKSAIQRATSSVSPIRPSGTWSASRHVPLRQREVPADGGVVHQAIDVAKRLVYRGDDPARAGWIGQVGRHAEDTAACLPYRIGAFTKQRFPPPG
jgi:hypothetical protein